jgi:hypothetical protein
VYGHERGRKTSPFARNNGPARRVIKNKKPYLVAFRPFGVGPFELPWV